MKLLSEIQYKAEERKRQVTTSEQVTTFQLPEATQATAGSEYILTIRETQAVSIPVVQSTQIATTQPATVIAKVQQPSASAQPTSYLVVDDQQPGVSRQDFQPTFSCSFTTGGKSTQHFKIIQSLQSYFKCATVPADRHTTAIFTLSTSTSTITSAIFHSSRTDKTSQPVQPANQQISPHKSHQNWPF